MFWKSRLSWDIEMNKRWVLHVIFSRLFMIYMLCFVRVTLCCMSSALEVCQSWFSIYWRRGSIILHSIRWLTSLTKQSSILTLFFNLNIRFLLLQIEVELFNIAILLHLHSLVGSDCPWFGNWWDHQKSITVPSWGEWIDIFFTNSIPLIRYLGQVADCCCRGDMAALEKVSDGMKPELLHSACHQGRVTSLTLAIKSGHLPVVEFLWSREAEQHLRDKASCLTLAIKSGYLYIVEFLLTRGVEQHQSYKVSCLITALSRYNFIIVKY